MQFYSSKVSILIFCFLFALISLGNSPFEISSDLGLNIPTIRTSAQILRNSYGYQQDEAEKTFNGKRAEITGHLNNVDFEGGKFWIMPYVEFTDRMVVRTIPVIRVLCVVDDLDKMNMLHGTHKDDKIMITGTIQGRVENSIVVSPCSLSAIYD